MPPEVHSFLLNLKQNPMGVCSAGFLVSLCLLVILFHLAATKQERQLLLCCANLAFLCTHVLNWQSWMCLALFIAGTYLMLTMVKADPRGRLVMSLIGVTLVVFVYFKRYPILELLLPHGLQLTGVEVVGLSYMLFKFIDALVHQWQGELAPCGLVSYANYQLAFFTLLAGPIQRYNDFQRCWDSMDREPGDVRATLQCLSRVLIGMLKIGLIAVVIEGRFLSHSLRSATEEEILQQFPAHFYAYPIYLYFNFSGYTDVAIGCGGLLGFSLPENFNRPFLARNLLDFWGRWHMTLTQWVRDLIFIPSYKNVLERAPSWSRPLGLGLLFLSMLVVGAWHGLTGAFLAFGRCTASAWPSARPTPICCAPALAGPACSVIGKTG